MDEEISFFDRPAVRATIKFVLLLALYFILGFGIPEPERALSGLVWDSVVCILGLALWTILFSQFILPVRKLGDRLAIFDRMMAYFSGFHGPSIFI